jgi:hypothetical protein
VASSTLSAPVQIPSATNLETASLSAPVGGVGTTYTGDGQVVKVHPMCISAWQVDIILRKGPYHCGVPRCSLDRPHLPPAQRARRQQTAHLCRALPRQEGLGRWGCMPCDAQRLTAPAAALATS